jgi:catecholate siderophore receptor
MRFLTAGALALSALTASPALADDGGKEVDETRVMDTIAVLGTYLSNEKFSGTKTQTPIVDVPQSLSVVTSAQIAEQAFTDMGDVLRYTPGASIGQGEGHRDQITIRGQNSTADFFIDGLRDDVQYFRPLYNIEQIEILRGSNAMIFGRGGGGGVVNRATKRPDSGVDIASLSVSADTFGEISGAIDYNTATSADSAIRINAFAESLNNHRDQFGGDRFAVNPTFASRLGPDTSLLLSYEFVDDDRVVDRGVPSDGSGAPLAGYDTFFFGSPDRNRTTLQANIAKARLDHRFSESLSINTTLQYADYDKMYQNIYAASFDAVADTVTLDGYQDETARDNLILQTNLVSEFALGGLVHTLLIGAEYANQQSANARHDNVFSDTNDDQTTIAVTRPLALPAFAFSNPVRNRRSDVQVLSVYAQDQVDLGQNFKLIAGLRFDRFEIDVNDLRNAARFSRADEEISPRIGIIYKPMENVSAYASYSKSFLPRSGDQFLELSDASAQLEPEEFNNQEIGIKWDMQSGLSLTAALFRLDRDTTERTADGEDSFVTTSETQGFEVQLGGQATDRWRVDIGYSYLDAELADGSTGSQVPAHMFSVWNRYDVSSQLGFGLGVIYQDEQFASASNAVSVPDFTRVDAGVFYTMRNGTVLQLNIENLLDEDYFPAAHNNNNISPGAPLNARFSVKTRF